MGSGGRVHTAISSKISRNELCVAWHCLLACALDFLHPMRLVHVAKALGMTGQQLRKELSTVDFGVKPTDREIPDTLAQGVLRYVARKHGITVNAEVLASMPDDDEGEEERQEQPVSREGAPSQGEPAAVQTKPSDQKPESLHVLRKLTLEGVSKEAIQRQVEQLKPPSKPELEER